MMEGATVLQTAGASQIGGEWAGQTSQKFRGSKMHIPEPQFKEVPHPLYTINKKRHYGVKLSDTYEWRPSIRVDNNKDAPRTEK